MKFFRLNAPIKRKQEKKDRDKLAVRSYHPRSRIWVKRLHVGGLQCVFIYVKFYKNRPSGFSAMGGRKSPFPITLATGLYNTLYYITSRDFIWTS